MFLNRGAGAPMQTVVGVPSTDGRIPFTFRIGVTGHRKLHDPESLAQAVREAISRLKGLVPSSPSSGLVTVVISALAEGADRLVAEQVLAEEKGSRLEVALPLPCDDYLNDFQEEDSKNEFRSLVERASAIWQAPPGVSREDAYESTGRYVVDRSDAIIALWDGRSARGRGGTAEIVAYARERGVPVVWINTEDPQTITYELATPRIGVIKDTARKLYEYNVSTIDASDFRAQSRTVSEDLMPDITADMNGDPLGLSRDKVADWLVPYFVRADVLTTRYQRRFRLLSWLIFALAAAAVTVVAIQTNFLPHWNWLAAIEVIFLLLLLSILWASQRGRLHDRWISYRFLAERLRSSYFLALVGTGDRGGRSVRLAYFSDSSEAWIERALTEVMAQRPELDTSSHDMAALREYLNRCWIENQICYHSKTAFLQRRWDDRLIRATELLFTVTLLAALLHMLESILHLPALWQKLLIVVSISVAAIGAAIHGIRTQRQFRHHSDRYKRMAGLLTQVRDEMAEAGDLERVREVAAETEQIMREENSDWFGVMRFQDMELIT
jgi:SMODS and SLOG-associating 2TM effector domain 1